MSFEVKITSHVDQTKEQLDEAVKNALERIGLQAESFAKAGARVDTGNLRNSITHTLEGDRTVMIGTNVNYAPYVEFGTGTGSETGGRQTPWVYMGADGRFHRTSGMAARPFLRPAVRDHTGEYSAIIKDALS